MWGLEILTLYVQCDKYMQRPIQRGCGQSWSQEKSYLQCTTTGIWARNGLRWIIYFFKKTKKKKDQDILLDISFKMVYRKQPFYYWRNFIKKKTQKVSNEVIFEGFKFQPPELEKKISKHCQFSIIWFSVSSQKYRTKILYKLISHLQPDLAKSSLE